MEIKEIMDKTKEGETMELAIKTRAIYNRTKNGLCLIKVLNEDAEINQRR